MVVDFPVNPGACLLCHRVGTAVMAALFTVLLQRMAQLLNLAGIFPAKVTGEQVHLQSPPPDQSKPVLLPVGDQVAGLVAGQHPFTNICHHPVSHILYHIR